MEYQKITNLLDATSDNVTRFITKKWVEIHEQSGSAEDRYKPSKQIRLKTSMLRSDLCGFSDAYIGFKGKITVTGATNSSRKNRPLALLNNAQQCKTMLHLLVPFQKLIIHSSIMQKT